MSAIRTIYRKTPPPPISFTLAESGEQIPCFIPGQCMCKVCHSRELEYVPYLEDARCKACRQWQQEETLDLV